MAKDSSRKSKFIRIAALLTLGSLTASSAFFSTTGRAQAGLTIIDARWFSDDQKLKARGTFTEGRERVVVSDAATGTIIGSAAVESDGKWKLEAEHLSRGPCRIAAEARGVRAVKDVRNAPKSCSAAQEPPTVAGSHAGRFSSYEGTKTCLACHEEEAREVHASVHYQWKGDSRDAINLGGEPAGKLGGINDFCIYPDINWIGKLTNLDGMQVDGGCAKCHAGLGDQPTVDVTQSQLENIDCLVCHSRDYVRKVGMAGTGFKFVPDEDKMPVSLLDAATDITLPGKDRCLNCHTRSGGGDNFKRGDIEEAHRNPSRSFDVHMASVENGGAGLQCIDCHTVMSHRIAGRGTDLRPRDSYDEVSCTKCHSSRPHDDEKIDKHTARVNCTVCHIPTYAKAAPTDMERDWSKPGEIDPAKRLYDPHMVKLSNVVPEYKFFNGLSRFYKFGDMAVPAQSGRVEMSAPEGDIHDPNAKIFAFKHHLGRQPIDPSTGRLLPLKIGIFFQSGNLDEAVEKGTVAVGWTPGSHDFMDTERYMGLFHEVAPKESALSCSGCHNGDNRLDFDALGYTPKTTYNNKPLCAGCHSLKSADFKKLHDKHVKDKKFDCSTCHTFSSAPGARNQP